MHLLLAACLFLFQDDDSLKALDELVKTEPKRASYERRGAERLKIAEVRADRGEDSTKLFEGAIEDFAIANKPGDAEGYMNLGCARAAFADFLNSRGKDPGNMAYQAKSDLDDAWTRNKDLPAVFHGRARAYLNLGEMLGETECLASALDNSDVAIRMDHKSPTGFAIRARILLAMGRAEEAAGITESVLKAGTFDEALMPLLGDRGLPTIEAAIKDEKFPAKKERLEWLADRIRETSRRRVELSDVIAKYIERYQADKPSTIQRAEEWLIQIGEPALDAIDKLAANSTDKNVAHESRNLSRLIRKRAEMNSVRFPVHGAIKRIRDEKDPVAAMKREFPEARIEIKQRDEPFAPAIKEALGRHDGWTFVETIQKLPDDDAKRAEDDTEKITRPTVRSKTLIFKVGNDFAVVTFR